MKKLIRAIGPNPQEPVHTPGYLTIHCSEDDQLGITLILQWLPNTLLEKTPTRYPLMGPGDSPDLPPPFALRSEFACPDQT